MPGFNHHRHWVFDMDGTLTVGIHDFAAIRRHLEVPEGVDILDHLDALPAQQREAGRIWLFEHERELALRSTAANGAVELVRRLCERGDRLGILTRNDRALAYITLEAIGLAGCFQRHCVLGRDEATPKPDPGGLEFFIDHWQVDAEQLVMVGDSRMDMACGRAAGTRTLLVNAPENDFGELTDWQLPDCRALLAGLE
ncbi:HAD family hydrolase [Kushneria aurantia]|uniref:HAD family hydrolase n=1 Tax=Kushneria aurantia TaxID=504092 RepID=A0ABV6G076_9GAMM|nr:HAD-IA family hydrolase [Kushneria aurantia]